MNGLLQGRRKAQSRAALWKPRFHSAVLLASVVLGFAAHAQSVEPYEEFGKRLRAAQEVTPLKQDFEVRQQQEQQRQIIQEANQVAASQFEQAKEWPGFLVDAAKGTVDPDLAKAFAEHQDWSLERAYIATVVPKLRAKEQAQVLDDLKTKAAASSGVNPGGSVTTTRRPKDFNDPSLKWS